MDAKIKNVTIIGAGVIGLTTALKLQELGWQVTIVAEHLPTDEKNIGYASCWAGAHHVSVAGPDEIQRKIQLETFHKMWDMSASGSPSEQCFMRLPQEEHYVEEEGMLEAVETLRLMPNFSRLAEPSLASGASFGITYDTVNTDVPVFLQYLVDQFTDNGGFLIRSKVQHINQVIEGAFVDSTDSTPNSYSGGIAPPDAVINCSGIGARFLGGVEDASVYPVRGQVLRIRAPWVNRCVSLSGTHEGQKKWTYVIPRRSGDVIVGGTYEVDDWFSQPRSETTTDILERVLKLCPEIAASVEDARSLIIEEGCGLRPGRKGGVRLESEWMESGGRRVLVVHNYGHGGFGYLASFGSATVVADLLAS